MTTSTYNPIILAFRILTTARAFRWYGTQAKAAATFASTITLRGFTTAQRLLNDRKSVALAAVAQPKQAIAMSSAIAQTETIAPTIAQTVQDESNAVDELETVIAPSQEYAFTEAIEPDESTTSDDWQADEANATFATAQDDAIAQQSGREHDLHFHSCLVDILQDDAIAPANEPEQCDHMAMDEVEGAIAFSEAEPPDFGEAIASDGDTFAWVDDAPLDEDPTERRPWAEAEDLESAIAQTTEPDEEDDTFFAAEPAPAEDFADDADELE